MDTSYIDRSVDRFAALMKEKLHQHRAKGPWAGTPLPVLRAKFHEEFGELEHALGALEHFMRHNGRFIDPRDIEAQPFVRDVLLEAADAAALLMMIADESTFNELSDSDVERNTRGE